MCQSVQGNNVLTYAEDEVAIVARLLVTISHCYAQQFNLRKGLKEFGNSGVEATQAELGQLHYRNCWRPVSVKELTRKEKYCAQEGLMLLTQKRSGPNKRQVGLQWQANASLDRQRGQK